MAPKEEFSSLKKKFPLRTVLEMQKKVTSASVSISKGDKQKAKKYLQKDRLRE
jgi:hypothetical protein